MKEDGFDIVAPSNIPMPDGGQPRALTVEEIGQYVKWYADAAENAMKAGFDGIEIHRCGLLLSRCLPSDSPTLVQMAI
jgi:NADPH2 dehydrogenase